MSKTRGAGYALNDLKPALLRKIGSEIAALHSTKQDKFTITGDEWQGIFHRSINGQLILSKDKIEDVTKDNTAWSLKTVKSTKKHIDDVDCVKLISGRNSLEEDFSVTAKPGKDDPNKIGEKVLEIWNDRIKETNSYYSDVRILVLIRGKDAEDKIFRLFEVPAVQYDIKEYDCSWNKNMLNFIEKSTGKMKFKWQATGSQFTIFEDLPEKVRKMTISYPPEIKTDDILSAVHFDADTQIEIK